MTFYISKTLINELVSRTNIVDVINERVPLKKQGTNFIACCPFHTEHNPSFTVSIKKQFYYCFSCGSYGNVITFLMNYDQLTFLESIQKLSIIHGVSIKRNLKVIHNKDHYKNNLYKLMNNLCTFYQNNLISNQYLYAYKYLKDRGLTKNSFLEFNIGFAPNEWNKIIKNSNLFLYNQQLINQSGMLVQYKNNKYDRFRDRIMFPMRDKLGRVIAFGGRILKYSKNTPKYLNSPDTKIFKKSEYLYGLYEVQQKYKNIPYILLVEGYMDVIILTQFGIKYVVASLGTMITTHQMQLIYNITNQIICCYDGDNSGKKAAWRTLNMALSYLTDDREICFMFLPDQEDPDTLIRKIGKDNFLKQISQAQNISNFLFDTFCAKVNLQTLEGRVKLSSLVLPMINKIPGQTLRLCLRQKLGNKIGILDDNKLDQLLSKQSDKMIHTQKKNYITYNLFHILIGLLIQNPKLAKLVPTIQELKKLQYNKIMLFADLVQICRSYPTFTTSQLIQYYNRSTKHSFFSYLEKLVNWNHMINKNVIEITFIDALTKLCNLILEQRQNMLIALDRTSKLTQEERQELWLLTQSLSTR